VKIVTAETVLTMWLATALPAPQVPQALEASTGSSPVEARVVPPTAYAPSDVLIEAIIEPDAHNRYVEVVIDSGAFFSSSTAELDGERAPRKKEVRFRKLPAGTYKVSVTIFGTDGRRGTAVRYVSLW
jgi:hypothetical protein